MYLKLECLQPIGSFKIRGASNVYGRSSIRMRLAGGVYTASAGNMAQGVAWNARRLGGAVLVGRRPTRPPGPSSTPSPGSAARSVPVPFDEWQEVMRTRHVRPPRRTACSSTLFGRPGGDGRERTIGLEILEDLPDVDAVVVP